AGMPAGDEGFERRPVAGTPGGETYTVALTREVGGRRQRIIVSGMADFLNNTTEGIGRRNVFGGKLANYPLGISLFRWLANDRYPVLVERPRQLEKLVLRNAAL